MKINYLSFNISELEEIEDLLIQNEINQFQVIDRVLARSKSGTPRMDTSVWPGYNSVIIVQSSLDETEKLHKLVVDFNNNTINPDERIIFCSLSLDKYEE